MADGKPRGMTDDYYAHTRHVGPVAGCPHCPEPFNDPPADSLFRKVDRETCVCKVCDALVANNTEGRDGHLNRAGCHV